MKRKSILLVVLLAAMWSLPYIRTRSDYSLEEYFQKAKQNNCNSAQCKEDAVRDFSPFRRIIFGI